MDQTTMKSIFLNPLIMKVFLVIFAYWLGSCSHAQTIPLERTSKIATFMPNSLDVMVYQTPGLLEVFNLNTGQRTRTLNALKKYDELCDSSSKRPSQLNVVFVIPRDDNTFYTALHCAVAPKEKKSWMETFETAERIGGIIKIDTDEFIRDDTIFGYIDDGQNLRHWTTQYVRHAAGKKLKVRLGGESFKITQINSNSVMEVQHPACIYELQGVGLSSDEQWVAVGSSNSTGCKKKYNGIFVASTKDGSEYKSNKIQALNKKLMDEEKKRQIEANTQRMKADAARQPAVKQLLALGARGLYLEAGKAQRNGSVTFVNTSFGASELYEMIVDKFPDSEYAVKATDQLTAMTRSNREQSATRSAAEMSDFNSKQRAYEACRVEMNSCYARTNGKGNCYRDCERLR